MVSCLPFLQVLSATGMHRCAVASPCHYRTLAGTNPPRAGTCRLMFNPMYKFIYIKAAKVGGTSFKNKFGGYCGGKQNLQDAQACSSCGAVALCSNNQTCSAWPDYCATPCRIIPPACGPRKIWSESDTRSLDTSHGSSCGRTMWSSQLCAILTTGQVLHMITSFGTENGVRARKRCALHLPL